MSVIIEPITEYKIIPEWYSPGEVWNRFSVPQIVWLIPYLPLLRDGVYPHNTKETGYIDTPIGNRHIESRAKFITASDIYAELSCRLQQCGWEGLITEMSYSADADDRLTTMQHISEALEIEVEELEWRVKRVLRYIRGKNRKQRSFKDWRFHKRGENIRRINEDNKGIHQIRQIV